MNAFELFVLDENDFRALVDTNELLLDDIVDQRAQRLAVVRDEIQMELIDEGVLMVARGRDRQHGGEQFIG